MHRRDHGKAFLTLIGALNHLLLSFKAFAKSSFFFLPGFCLHVDGQNHKIDDKTHHDDGPSPLLGDIKSPKQGLVHPVFKRSDEKGI